MKPRVTCARCGKPLKAVILSRWRCPSCKALYRVKRRATIRGGSVMEQYAAVRVPENAGRMLEEIGDHLDGAGGYDAARRDVYLQVHLYWKMMREMPSVDEAEARTLYEMWLEATE